MRAAEILLVGTGERTEMMPPALRQYLSKAGVQVDVMNTVCLAMFMPLPAAQLIADSEKCMLDI